MYVFRPITGASATNPTFNEEYGERPPEDSDPYGRVGEIARQTTDPTDLYAKVDKEKKNTASPTQAEVGQVGSTPGKSQDPADLYARVDRDNKTTPLADAQNSRKSSFDLQTQLQQQVVYLLLFTFLGTECDAEWYNKIPYVEYTLFLK